MDDHHIPLGLEKRYGNSIWKYFQEMLLGITGDPSEYLSSLQDQQLFRRMAGLLAEQFISQIYKHNVRSWKDLAANTRRAREIHIALKAEMAGPLGDKVRALIDYNAFLITSTPVNISKELTRKAMLMQQEGLRAEAIREELIRIAPNLTYNRAQLIARTEASKASTALTRARSFQLNLPWYVWSTSRDIRVRDSHKKMNNVMVGWSDPPSPEALDGEKFIGRYNAGDIYNCRCVPLPVIDLKYLSWPHKVYMNGEITKMPRIAFERRVGLIA